MSLINEPKGVTILDTQRQTEFSQRLVIPLGLGVLTCEKFLFATHVFSQSS